MSQNCQLIVTFAPRETGLQDKSHGTAHEEAYSSRVGSVPGPSSKSTTAMWRTKQMPYQLLAIELQRIASAAIATQQRPPGSTVHYFCSWRRTHRSRRSP